MPFSASLHAVMAPPNPLPITMASYVRLISVISVPVRRPRTVPALVTRIPCVTLSSERVHH